MVPVTTAADIFTARVIAARLGSEGIITELRGGDGPYPIGEVTVCVEHNRLDEAGEILLIEEAAAAVDGVAPLVRVRAPARWLVVGALVLTAVFAFVRMFG